MSGPYTLTIHIAEGGTPTFNPKTNAWEDARNNSSAGHMWYSVRDESLPDEHPDKENSYGFAPEDEKSGVVSVAGEVSPDDNITYQQPLYERMFEISGEQYKSLKEFGQNGMDKQWDFFSNQYHSVNNSCVDFTWGPGVRFGTLGLSIMSQANFMARIQHLAQNTLARSGQGSNRICSRPTTAMK